MLPARPLLAAFWDLYSALLWPLASALPSIILSVSALSSFSRINHPTTSSPNSEILSPEKELASPEEMASGSSWRAEVLVGHLVPVGPTAPTPRLQGSPCSLSCLLTRCLFSEAFSDPPVKVGCPLFVI